MDSRSSPLAPSAIPDRDALIKKVVKAWRRRGYGRRTIRGYRRWIVRHRASCESAGENEFEALTREHVVHFARDYAARIEADEAWVFASARTALHAWSKALSSMGIEVPRWAPSPPTPFAEVVRYWQEQGYCLQSIRQHLTWMKRHVAQHGAVRPELLTRREALRLGRYFGRKRRLGQATVHRAKAALHAWSKALAALGTHVPPWVPPRRARREERFAELLAEFGEFRRRVRGNREPTIEAQCRHARALLDAMRKRRRPLESMTVADVDRFLVDVHHNAAPNTVKSVYTSVRSFLRFLHVTGRIATDLAASIGGPSVGRVPDPPQPLSWSDVRKILGAVDRTTLIGKRDYAFLLVMASYGMGRDEVRTLRLDDIDWQEGVLRVVRVKTGVVTELPLLGPVADALVAYLRAGPPRSPSVRNLFLRSVPPPAPLSREQMRVRFLFYARKAGLIERVHMHGFRHAHATRQVESAAPPRVVSEILGQANTSSLSTYVRVALEKLRPVCLPLP